MASLGKFTVLLDPANAKAAVEFGNSEKARMACDAAFQLANRRARPAAACGCTAHRRVCSSKPATANAPENMMAGKIYTSGSLQ